jgi:hypothetical protein
VGIKDHYSIFETSCIEVLSYSGELKEFEILISYVFMKK